MYLLIQKPSFNSWHQSTEYNPLPFSDSEQSKSEDYQAGIGSVLDKRMRSHTKYRVDTRLGGIYSFLKWKKLAWSDDVYMYVANATSANSPFVEWSAKYGVNKLISVELEGYYQNYTDSTGTSLNGINDVFLQIGYVPVKLVGRQTNRSSQQARWIGNIAREGRA